MRHNNPSISQYASRIFNPKAFDQLTDQVDQIVATIELQPVQNIVKSAGNTASATSNTIFTTPSDKNFFLTRAHVNFIKNATCDVSTGTLLLNVTVDGAVVNLLRFSILTLTAQEIDHEVSFDPPVKIDRGTAIQLAQGTFTAGAFVRCCSISGYTEETTS